MTDRDKVNFLNKLEYAETLVDIVLEQVIDDEHDRDFMAELIAACVTIRHAVKALKQVSVEEDVEGVELEPKGL